MKTRWTIAAGVVVVLFVLACCSRLDESIFLDPDGTEFLLLARGLATGNGYRDVSKPDWPMHTLRPPGFPILLTPAALLAPYSVIAGKVSVVLCAVVMLVVLWRLAATRLGSWLGFVVLLLFATNPATLWYATDVCSEVPYTACTLALVLLATVGQPATVEPRESNGSSCCRKWSSLAGFVLLALAPLVRLVGLSLTLAALAGTVRVGLAGDQRSTRGKGRWNRALFVLASLLPVTMWMGHNYLTANAAGSYASLISRPRPDGAIPWAIGSIAFYADALAAYAIPALPVHSGLVMLMVPAAGMYLDRRGVGGSVLVYCVLYFSMISVYPFRHSRLVWPLVPLTLLWGVPALHRVMSWFFERLALGRWTTSVFLVGVSVWTAWQSITCLDWVAAGVGYWRVPKLGWSHLAPPELSDWQSAGWWLRENTAPYARVLSRDKSLVLWSRRAQFEAQFEGITAPDLQNAIRNARAHYLVMRNWDEGATVPVERLASDPVYHFEQVYDAGNVVIYRVEINRTGTVPEMAVDFTPILQRLESNEGAGRDAIWREFLRGHFLRRAGRAGEAIALLESNLEKTPRNLPVVLELAACLIEIGKFEEAISWYRRAEQMAGANEYSGATSGGIAIASEFLRFHNPRLPAAQRAAAGLRIALSHLEMGRYSDALAQLDACLNIAPSEPSCLYARGVVLQRLGRVSEAIESFRDALAGGVRDALPKLLLLLSWQALDGSEPVELHAGETRFVVDPRKSEDFLNVAKLAVRDGIPGVALATLEQARERFPDDASVLLALGDLCDLFGEWRLAEDSWSRAAEIQPERDTAARLREVHRKMTPHRFP